MNQSIIYKLANLFGVLFGRFIDDGKFSKGDFLKTIFDLGEIQDILNNIGSLKGELLAMDTETAAEASRLFHAALGENASKTTADELFGQFMQILPTIYGLRAAIVGPEGDTNFKPLRIHVWNSFVRLGDHVCMILDTVFPQVVTIPALNAKPA